MASQTTRRELPGLRAGTMEQGLGARQGSRAGMSATDPSKGTNGVGSSMQSRHLAHAEGEVAVSVVGCMDRQGMCGNLTG